MGRQRSNPIHVSLVAVSIDALIERNKYRMINIVQHTKTCWHTPYFNLKRPDRIGNCQMKIIIKTTATTNRATTKKTDDATINAFFLNDFLLNHFTGFNLSNLFSSGLGLSLSRSSKGQHRISRPLCLALEAKLKVQNQKFLNI